MKEKNPKEEKLIRPTVAFSAEENKLIDYYCIDFDINKGEFLRRAALYCITNKIDLRK